VINQRGLPAYYQEYSSDTYAEGSAQGRTRELQERQQTHEVLIRDHNKLFGKQVLKKLRQLEKEEQKKSQHRERQQQFLGKGRLWGPPPSLAPQSASRVLGTGLVPVSPATPTPAMPPQVGRMHHSHPSNPFQHLNSQHSIPQSSYQSQASHLPGSFTSQPSFGGSAINGGISPFPSASAYGASAFTPGVGSSVFNGGAIGGQGQGQGLASVAAQQGFARGAAMQEHTAHQLEAASMDSKSGANSRIRQVWRHNLEQEMAVLRQLIIKYPYVSMVRYHSFSGIGTALVPLLACAWSFGGDSCQASQLGAESIPA
jgi:hypothetical protein